MRNILGHKGRVIIYSIDDVDYRGDIDVMLRKIEKKTLITRCENSYDHNYVIFLSLNKRS